MTAGSAFHNGYPVGSLAVAHAEAAFLPIDQGVEPVKEFDTQDQVRVYWHHAEVDVESERVHDDVYVHAFGAGNSFP